MSRNASRWVLAAAAAVIAGCGSERPPNTAGGRGQVIVSAASSLAGAFAELERLFEQGWPGTDIVLNLGGTPSLREQILSGAPVGVFASADAESMRSVGEAGLIADRSGPAMFARNRVVAVTPFGNPGGAKSVEDFGREDLVIGLCALQVPCGRLAARALEKAGIEVAADTEEPHVRGLVAKLTAGELDLAMVYMSDLVARGDALEPLDQPFTGSATAQYWIAPLAGGEAEIAAAFVRFVLGAEGREVLRRHAFLLPADGTGA